MKPTILDGVPAASELSHTEIFGPVLSLVHANDMDEAIAFLERNPYGNQASLFTSSGAAARRFRYEAPAGNVGINIGVAAPMAYFPVQRLEGQLLRHHARPGPRLQSSSTPRRKWSSSAGPRSTRASSRARACGCVHLSRD